MPSHSWMTPLRAKGLRLADRGVLAEGKLASVVLCDAATFTDHATWLDPQRYAEGVKFLFVNGGFVVDGGAVIAGRQLPVVARRPRVKDTPPTAKVSSSSP